MGEIKAPLPPVIAPRAGGDIIVRQFRPSDAPQVHALLLEGLVYGPESPRNTALRRSLTRPVALLAYSGLLLGSATLYLSLNPILRVSGITICTASLALLLYFWHSIHIWFINYCLHARRTDMKDITKTYEIPADGSGLEQGPGGFFVAAIEDGKSSEVVGYLGLDYHVSSDPTSAEFRRMMVSSRHRRRRIASLLLGAAIAHARTRSPPLLTLDLETTEFQPGARKLYERHGFEVVRSSLMTEGLFFRARMLRLRRSVDG
ncbi:acyl-CoA N-acyltransferase [Roridomyces roridus]|uniref:Acyl-CoA N-acyltransferase n=1 Tax=Roridomyces roridus TaxID=1738132 RepID=A0AAD7BGQ9_9AGAR|nr:acyl-CoA N-acyltransferase [Roridomyces roridus]